MQGGFHAVLRTDVFSRRLDCRALNLAGAAAVAVKISWVLFLIGVVLLGIHLVMGRTVRVP